eukprot:gene1322-2545_t
MEDILIPHQGFKPLLILHTRHFQFDGLSDKILSIIHSWRDANILYESPAGCNDDWFWLYATVILRCKVLTNDEMRDHHFQMLSPRWFARWKERHQIKYSFTRSFHSNSTSTLSISSTSNMGVGSGVTINNTSAPAADTASSELIVAAAAVDGTEQNLINSSTVDILTSTSGISLIGLKLSIPLPYSLRMQCLKEEKNKNRADNDDVKGLNVKYLYEL